ncbi:MAG: sulfotransferase domain-containing protein [Myxococcales bacterium]|nr:sulfotransferase domain-containing protein [Myxococcales bacterium]
MPLPDFIIIGAQKCGTTSAIANLTRHPMVETSVPQPPPGATELHFFDVHWNRGLAWYRAQFPEADGILGEKTPAYVFHPHALERMHRTLPDAKLILLLRNPTDRAYSQWTMLNRLADDYGRSGWGYPTFDEAFAKDLRGIRSRGDYAPQLARVLRYYHRDQVLVAITERVRADLQAAYTRMFRFLGVPDDPDLRFEIRPSTRRGSPLDATTRATCGAHYAAGIETLREQLNDPLDEWTDARDGG